MVTCPKCKAENRPEAAFCSRCGTILFAQPIAAKAVEQPEGVKAVITPMAVKPIERSVVPQVIEEALPEVIEPEPTLPKGFMAQTEDTVFGDRFVFHDLIAHGEHENIYTVTESKEPGAQSVRTCSNPECRTIHCPVGADPEKFCTQCGHPLEERSQLFLLKEADADNFSYTKHVIELNLVHPNIHPPIAAFQQELAGIDRFYLVTPYSSDLPDQPSITDVLDWGVQLAGALDYLQSKGMVIGEEIDPINIGLVDDKAVWRNFTSVRILPMLTDREKINNLRLLGLAMYTLMTGSTSYSMDPYLPPALNQLFERALVGEGFTTGAEFIQQVELAKDRGTERLTLDYLLGRRSHAGKVRELNEDSLLTLELTMMRQGRIQPCGLLAIADGMGGHSAGDLASGLVIETIGQKGLVDMPDLLNPANQAPDKWLDEAIQLANLAVYEARQQAGNDMGSTVAVCLLLGAQIYLTHQGDSRIYLVNQTGIQQLTTDHSLVQHMVSTGQISQDEARFHPQRNVIYRSLGDKPYVEVECLSRQLFPQDRLLLCSDGLTNLLEDEKIHKIVMEASSPQVACDKLIDAANSEGGEDNLSVIVVEVISR